MISCADIPNLLSDLHFLSKLLEISCVGSWDIKGYQKCDGQTDTQEKPKTENNPTNSFTVGWNWFNKSNILIRTNYFCKKNIPITVSVTL